jgi:hypothetical protein
MTKLEKATHGFLIAVCCVSLFMLIESRMSRASHGPAASLHDPVGHAVKLSGVDWQAAPLTVLLHLNSNCHFCKESMPFYQKLAATHQQRGPGTALIVSSQDSVRVMEEYLAKEQVTVDKVLQAQLDSIGVAGTPTVLIVDSQGVVKRAFQGKLNQAREKELLSIIERGTV